MKIFLNKHGMLILFLGLVNLAIPTSLLAQDPLTESPEINKKAQEINDAQILVDKIEITHFGTLSPELAALMSGFKMDALNCVFMNNPLSVQTADKIQAGLGVTFGVGYKVVGSPSGKQVELGIVIKHPQINRPNENKSYQEDHIKKYSLINQVDSAAWVFADSWEIVPGEWIFEIYHKGNKLAEQKFLVEKGSGQGISDQWAKQLAEFDQILAKNPNDAGTLNGRANAFLEMGDLEKAIEEYTKSMAADPQFPSPYNGRSRAYSLKGDFQKSLEDANKALELNPNYAFAFINRGNTYEQMQQYELAIKDYDKAIELNPSYADSYYDRGISLAHSGKIQEAINDYTKAIELDPNHRSAYNNRALLYRQQGNWAKAIGDFLKAAGK